MHTCFGHADSTVNDGEGLVGLVRNNPDEKLRLSLKLALISQTLEPDLVQCLDKK